MTDRNPAPEMVAALRRLLDEATPGPWIRPWGATYVHWMGGDDALTSQVDIDLAVAARNILPDLLDELDRLRAAAGYDVVRIEEGERLRAVAATVEGLADILDSLSMSVDGPEPWPWHVEGQLVANGGDCTWWLDNDRQTSAFPDGDDVAAMLNALLDIRAALAASDEAPRNKWLGVESATGSDYLVDLAASDEAVRPERTEYTPLSNDYGDDEP